MPPRLLLLLTMASAVCLAQETVKLEFLGDLNVPTGVDFLKINEPPDGDATAGLSIAERKASGGFGGLSGLAYDPSTRLLYALSDSSRPTVFVLEVVLRDGKPAWSPREVFQLADRAGVEIPLWTLDPEGLALTSDGGLLVASEGYVRRDPAVDPGVFLFDRRRRLVRSYGVPEHFLPHSDPEMARGVRHNEGFEGLTLSPDEGVLYAALEGPLVDEHGSCVDVGGCEVRIVEYSSIDDGGDGPVAEYAYRLEPAEAPEGFEAVRRGMGLSEILALDGRRLLALERGYALAEDGAAHQVIRLYQTDVPPRPAPGVARLEKRLVLDLAEVAAGFSAGFRTLDNFEGMCLGPRLEDGSETILMISDNNYSARQRTSLLAFRLVE